MGDDTYYTIQIKGTAYRFKPIPENDLAMVLTVANMGASQVKILKALNKVIGDSAGVEQWDTITDRLIAGEIKPAELYDVFKAIMARQNDKTEPAKKTAARKRATSAQ
jgi:sulfite reductase beta subunit-like hemoprotein